MRLPTLVAVTMNDIVKEHMGFDFETLDQDDPASLAIAKEKAIEAGVPNVADLKSVGYVLNQCFEELCESKVRICEERSDEPRPRYLSE